LTGDFDIGLFKTGVGSYEQQLGIFILQEPGIIEVYPAFIAKHFPQLLGYSGFSCGKPGPPRVGFFTETIKVASGRMPNAFGRFLVSAV